MSVGIGGGIAIAGGLTAAGSVIGGLGSRSSSDGTSYTELGTSTPLESMAAGGMPGTYNDLMGMTGAGPGMSDVTAATGASRDLASMLQDYSKNGAIPTGTDITRGNDLASALFGYQQTALNQSFTNQNQMAEQLAARLGRSVDDPVIQTKLRLGQINQQALLDASKGGFAANYAMNQPMQRLQFGQQRVGLLNGLASQAFQNRASMLSMGSQLLNAERNWQYMSGVHHGTQQQTQGGGLAGALAGGLSGLGMGLSTYGMLAGAGVGRSPVGGGGGMPGSNISDYTGLPNTYNYGSNAADYIGLKD